MLCAVIAELCAEHQYLLNSDKVALYDRRVLTHIINAEATQDDYDHILCYGISFLKKCCLVKKKETISGDYYEHEH